MKTNFNQNQLDSIAKQILSHVDTKVICFYGPMGAGKTTLIKALIRELGAIDNGNSPTFALVNSYETAEAELLAYHFDFYRITNEIEALDMGIEEYFSSGAYIFIEWPERIQNILPQEHHKIDLQFIDENTRSIEI